MSDINEPNNDLILMEYEIRITRAQLAKQELYLRVAKREAEIKRDIDHIALQDKEIEKAQQEINRLKSLKNS